MNSPPALNSESNLSLLSTDSYRRKTPQIRLYDLRHSHATLLLLADEQLRVVSQRLGHSTIRLAADTYQHFLELALDVLADGTIDVRGISRATWPQGAAYTLEGTGNANFVIPGQ